MIFDPKAIEWHYVNLDSRPDRDAHARNEFAKVGITARRQRGYLPHEWPGDKSMVEQMRRRTPGAIGCFQSQLAVMRTVIGTDRVVAVCEDDVCFCADLKKRLEYIATNVPEDWQVFWLGSTVHVNPAVWHKKTIGRDLERTADPRIFRAYGLWGTYAYLVNGRHAAHIVDLLESNMYRSDGIDDCFIKWLEPQIKSYCFMPGCAWQYDNRSNIGVGDTIFSHFKKLGPYVWQERMEDFDPGQFNWAEASTK